ncbi:MAG: class I SAM-dependent methyltransferase [Bacteroidota bacterium]
MQTDPYTALAAGYDVVMAHVDYEDWAAYVEELIQAHAPHTETVLELGCGTGSLAFALQPYGPYRYLATDGAPPMVRVAQAKRPLHPEAHVRFRVADFAALDPAALGAPFDTVLLLYDGLNYLLSETDVAQLLTKVSQLLAADGVFIVDQSTPANSLNNADYFHDEGQADQFAYVRTSAYDAEARRHTNAFRLTVQGETYEETHVQRAYTIAEMDALIAASPLRCIAAYDGFSDVPATEETERIHWVLARAAT